MIQAMVFDLDGTLVQTEILKATSYARAALELSGGTLDEQAVISAFEEVVGLPRREVAIALLERFHLIEAARPYMERFGVATPWQAFVQIRRDIYQRILSEPHMLQNHLCPYNTGLLHWARRREYATALATMSHREQVAYVLQTLELNGKFDFIATRDDVEIGKPDPEIYFLIAEELHCAPAQCLVIEDSTNGIRAALDAGMWCVAVTNDFTRKKVYQSRLLEDEWIVDYPQRLQTVVQNLLFKLELA